ncbi:unnamed protein product, partial [Rotaria sordida]
TCDSLQTPIDTTITINDNENNFTLVKKRKKKIKIDLTNSKTPGSDTSSPSSTSTSSSSNSSSSISINESTSSTNTDSLASAKQTTRKTSTTTNLKQVHSSQKSSEHVQQFQQIQSGKATTKYTTQVHDLNLQINEVSEQARRFAQTRYTFPPYILKFQQVVNEKLIIKNLIEHFSSTHNFDLQFAGHRMKDHRELLLFVLNRETFLMLYENRNWPITINSIDYLKISPSHLPPQFSIMLRNVPLDIDINEFASLMKIDYPDIMNVHRISNKLKQPTSFLLKNERFPVKEYIAPAKVLICSKCFQIGHFRGTCKGILEYCRLCGNSVPDLKLHKESCDNQLCCIRCKGQHDANGIRCPEVKAYRAALTKSLLTSTTSNTNNNYNNHQVHSSSHTNFRYNDQDFPLLNHNYMNSHSKNNDQVDFTKRIDELAIQSNKIKKNLNRLIELNNNFVVQQKNMQHLITNHDRIIQIQQLDLGFQKDLVNHFILPVWQVLIEFLPLLVQQQLINDTTSSCQSLTALCTKLGNDLTLWSQRSTENENAKNKLSMELNLKNNQQVHQNYLSCSNAPPPPTN